MRLAAIEKTTLLDFPGRVACTIFTQGCQYDCFYCHNRNLITVPGADAGTVSQEEVFAFLAQRKGLLEGVVVSGGEPTVHSDLPEFVARIKSLGYMVKLDTNGSSPTMVEGLVTSNLVDYVALDVKAPWNRYREICGKGADPLLVERTLRLLQQSDIDWEQGLQRVLR